MGVDVGLDLAGERVEPVCQAVEAMAAGTGPGTHDLGRRRRLSTTFGVT